MKHQKKHLKLALCLGRHEIPMAEGSVFPTQVNPLDVKGLEKKAAEALKGCKKLDLYVTGLTVALVAALNVCHKHNIDVTVWHFNNVNGEYYPQEVL